MPPKAKIQQPIDRPLSRAVLRQFKGWSTAYPPGMSEPNSLRRMENVMVNRDQSCRVRPGLRYLSYDTLPELDPETDEIVVPGVALDVSPVSSHEAFYLNDGSKAYLFAVREDDGTVGFRVLTDIVHDLAWAGFTFQPDEPSLHFTAATRYVRFLQIDNKIFALSDAGEPMREFFVGTTKRAVKLNAIDRPEWSIQDKLDVMHPEAAWINSGAITSFRKNLIKFPSFESEDLSEIEVENGTIERSDDFAQSGDWSLKVTSAPEKTNYLTQPLGDVNTSGDQNWYESTNANMSIHAGSNSLEWIIATAAAPGGPEGEDMKGWLASPMFDIDPDVDTYQLAVDVVAASNVRKMGYKALFFNSSGVQVGSTQIFLGSAPALGRKTFTAVTKPSQSAVKMRFYMSITRDNGAAATWARINNVTVVDNDLSNNFFDGDSGANYFWAGAAHNSQSTYHPPQDVFVRQTWNAATTGDHRPSLYARAGSGTADVLVRINGFMGSGNVAGVGAWIRCDGLTNSPAATGENPFEVEIQSVDRGQYIYIDSLMVEAGNTLEDYFDGSFVSGVGVIYDWTGTAHESTSTESTYAAPATVPDPETPAADTLKSSVAGDNDYNFGFFYTFSNEIGESAASQATIIKVKRPWSGWEWMAPDADGEPDPTSPVVDPALAADQLAAVIPEDVFDAAVEQGAIQWTLYMFTWSNQDPVPVSALKVGVRQLNVDSVYDEVGWLTVTPAQSDYGTETNVLPSLASRYNYSNPSRGGQGLVASDRMVLVKDPAAAAVIRWTSNRQGSYTDFSASKGGGYKTLTSGNLQLPAAVKLWQNPESKDSLIILTLGTDGHSTGYYMAPAQVASQSEATNIMGFEETTATPGTTSPYGVEVQNNALYHPLNDQLMKSTANNYNIAHKSVTDQIQNMWRELETKEWIISSQHDNRLYFIVNNSFGEPLEEGCNGNEVWVFDAQAEAGNWSRFLIQATSLRKLEQQDKICMSVVRPDGIFYLDEDYAYDDWVTPAGYVSQRNIPWYMETNTQGANRAHDAWCHLQQLELTAGNFNGWMRWGLIGWDRHGKRVVREKITSDVEERGTLPWDVQDQLLIKREMKEWFFFAGSILVDDTETVAHSEGQVSLVTYRYAPISVNVGYEMGSIETFEYGRAVANTSGELTYDGVPIPFNDRGRP